MKMSRSTTKAMTTWLLAALPYAAAAGDSPRSVAQLYSDAYVKKDFAAVARLTHKRVIDTFLSEREFVEEMKKVSISAPWPTEHDLHISDQCAVGSHRLSIVMSQRTYALLQGSKTYRHIYLIHSDDAGKSWGVVDMSCTDEKTAQKIMPPMVSNQCGKTDLKALFDSTGKYNRTQ
jgi:hypothetical protein